jgi:hypothetical protein
MSNNNINNNNKKRKTWFSFYRKKSLIISKDDDDFLFHPLSHVCWPKFFTIDFVSKAGQGCLRSEAATAAAAVTLDCYIFQYISN